MEILQRRLFSILISSSRFSLNKKKSDEIKEDLPAPVVCPTTSTFQPDLMNTFRFYKARLRDKTQIMFVRTVGLFYIFKIGESSIWYFMLTSFKINWDPWDGHVGGDGLSEVISSSLARFMYWRILSTEVITDTDLLNCFAMYCRQTIRINDCEYC